MATEDQDRIEAARQSWVYRAIEATHGNQTKLGCILLSVIGKPCKSPPWLGPSCVITEEGLVIANFVGRDNKMHEGRVICDVQDLIDNFRGLADHIDASDTDRVEMFDELRKWVSKDFRADHDELKRHS